jgi:hypothetical protein
MNNPPMIKNPRLMGVLRFFTANNTLSTTILG